jgi:GTPase SAR1 family protein
LDPANENVPFKVDVDVRDLVNVEDVMKEWSLGPNGAMLYCMEYLEKNLDWLWEKLDACKDKYLIIDCPGQVELYTHHESIKNIVDAMLKRDFRVCLSQVTDDELVVCR